MGGGQLHWTLLVFLLVVGFVFGQRHCDECLLVPTPPYTVLACQLRTEWGDVPDYQFLEDKCARCGGRMAVFPTHNLTTIARIYSFLKRQGFFTGGRDALVADEEFSPASFHHKRRGSRRRGRHRSDEHHGYGGRRGGHSSSEERHGYGRRPRPTTPRAPSRILFHAINAQFHWDDVDITHVWGLLCNISGSSLTTKRVSTTTSTLRDNLLGLDGRHDRHSLGTNSEENKNLFTLLGGGLGLLLIIALLLTVILVIRRKKQRSARDSGSVPPPSENPIYYTPEVIPGAPPSYRSAPPSYKSTPPTVKAGIPSFKPPPSDKSGPPEYDEPPPSYKSTYDN